MKLRLSKSGSDCRFQREGGGCFEQKVAGWVEGEVVVTCGAR
jgi:hypothetical protein